MNILLGPAALDHYIAEKRSFPGGGALNMAYHWRQLGVPFMLLTRLAENEHPFFSDFFERNGIDYLPNTAVKPGINASIEVVINPDGQPTMENYIEGLTADFSLQQNEVSLIQNADWIHAILVEGIIFELERLGKLGALRKPLISADFFDFRHFTVALFAHIMTWVDVAFIGWPHQLEHPTVAGIRRCAQEMKRLVIMTLGARGVMVFDGREVGKADSEFDQYFTIKPEVVAGSTIGCGDAFAAYFMAEWIQSRDVTQAIAKAHLGGVRATTWFRALPDSAYSGPNDKG